MRSAVSWEAKCCRYRAQWLTTAHHALDLGLGLQPPQFQRSLLQRPLGGEHHFLGLSGTFPIDASEEEHQGIGQRMDGVVEPVPGTGQIVQGKGGGAA